MTACVVAFAAAFRVVVAKLQDNGSLQPGAVAEGLREYAEVADGVADPLTLALLDELRRSLLS